MSVTVLLERTLRPHHLPLLLGEEDGLYEDRELSVSLREPSDGTVGMTPLYEGDADYALASPLTLVHDYLAGNRPVGVGRFYHSEAGVLYRSDASLSSPEDLDPDHTVAVRGVDVELAGKLLNVMAGRSADDEGGPRLVPASGSPAGDLLDEEVHALLSASLNLEGVQLKQSEQPVDFWFFDEHGLPANNDVVLVTTRDRVDENPREVQRLLQALHDALTAVREETDRARSLYREHTEDREDIPGGDPLLFTALSELTSNFSQDFENYIQWGEFLREEVGREGFLDVDRLIDERLLPMDAMDL